MQALTEKRAVLLVVLSGVLWGTSFVAIKAGLEYVDVFWFAFLRMVLATIVGVGFLLAIGRLDTAFLRDRSVWFLGISSGIAFLFQYLALVYTTASKTALLVNLNVIGVALLSWKMYGERFGTRGLMSLILGALGLLLLTTNGDLSQLMLGQAFGDFLALMTAVIWSFFTIVSKQVVSRRGIVVSQVSVWVLLATAVFLAPFAMASGPSLVFQIPAVGWVFILYTAIFCTAIPYLLWNFGLTKMSATKSALILLVEILVAFLGGFALLGESLGVVAAVGALSILVAIVLAVKRAEAQ